MIRSVNETMGMGLEALDGSIGEIDDIYFDDHTWELRYYVVDVGKWLPGRKVLLPPQAVRRTTPGDPGLPMNLTLEQIRSSPEMDMDRPISRRAEMILYQHYGWMPYWFPFAPPPPVLQDDDPAKREREAVSGEMGGDPHLRSAREVIGYDVVATDGEIGHIDDFLFEDETAGIRYAVIDLRNWLPGKHVLIVPGWICDVKWFESKVYTNVTREAVRSSPEFNPATPIDSRHESELVAH